VIRRSDRHPATIHEALDEIWVRKDRANFNSLPDVIINVVLFDARWDPGNPSSTSEIPIHPFWAYQRRRSTSLHDE